MELEAFGLSYGLRTLSSGTAREALNVDVTNQAGFYFNAVSISIPYEAVISLRSGVDESNIRTGFARVMVSASTTSSSIFVPFSSFVTFGSGID
ncbi:MAG: hypothetical protein KF861_18795, partial [Planctomycetaceae bacterium]|nr:hypothetical protein [Planctomycetaceae bacterium]